ncbi:MAG: YtxH domain-containing protein [Thermodesulfovibrionales bacterium]
MTDREGGNTGSVLFAFLLGGIVGAGLAFLLAPQSGPETRRRISEFADDMREKAEGYARQARESIDETVKKSKGYVSEKKSEISSAIEAGKQAYHKEKERYAEEG